MATILNDTCVSVENYVMYRSNRYWILQNTKPSEN